MEEKPKLLKNIFRTLALVFAITIFSCSIPGLFLYRLYNLDLSHHFVFILENAIVVTLFFTFAGENQSVAAADEHLIGHYLFDQDFEYEVDWGVIEYGQMQVGRSQVDDLSNEEFQKEVEAFIERQWRLLREESDPTPH